MMSKFDNEQFIDESALEEMKELPAPPKKNLALAINEACNKTLSNQDKDAIAKRLDISLDVLQQRLYKNLLRPNEGQKRLSRDWVIAICSACGLDDGETDNVIADCGFATFDGTRVRRDGIIQIYLKCNARQKEPCHIDCFQYYLSQCNVDKLDLGKRKRIDDKESENIGYPLPSFIVSPYKKTGPIKLRTYGFDIKPYDNLAKQYYPGLSCAAIVPVEDDNSNRVFLKATSEETFYVCRESDEKILSYDAITNVPADFRNVLDELFITARKEKQRLDDLCNDTRNYGSRYGVNLKGERIHIFYEQYNYTYPYRNEYFLVEYCAGQMTYSVARKSMFLEEYLSPDEYDKHYHLNDRAKRKIYKHIEEVEDERKSVKEYSYLEEVYINRKSKFLELCEEVQRLLAALQAGKYVVRDDCYHDDGPGLINYYGLWEQFVEDDDDGVIIKNDAEIFTDNIGSVILTYEDLEEAFRLGIDNIADVCRIKLKLGSVSKAI